MKCLRKIIEQFCNHSKVKKQATMSYSERNLQMSNKMAWPSGKDSTCLASSPTTTLQISNGKQSAMTMENWQWIIWEYFGWIKKNRSDIKLPTADWSKWRMLTISSVNGRENIDWLICNYQITTSLLFQAHWNEFNLRQFYLELSYS